MLSNKRCRFFESPICMIYVNMTYFIIPQAHNDSQCQTVCLVNIATTYTWQYYLAGHCSGNSSPSSCTLDPTDSLIRSLIPWWWRHSVATSGECNNQWQHQPSQALSIITVVRVFIARQHSNAIARYWYSNSACTSVCHIWVLYRNGLTYRHTSFSIRQPHQSSFLRTKHLSEIPIGLPLI